MPFPREMTRFQKANNLSGITTPFTTSTTPLKARAISSTSALMSPAMPDVLVRSRSSLLFVFLFQGRSIREPQRAQPVVPSYPVQVCMTRFGDNIWLYFLYFTSDTNCMNRNFISPLNHLFPDLNASYAASAVSSGIQLSNPQINFPPGSDGTFPTFPACSWGSLTVYYRRYSLRPVQLWFSSAFLTGTRPCRRGGYGM